MAAAEGLIYEIAGMLESAFSREAAGKVLQESARTTLINTLSDALSRGVAPLAAAGYALDQLFQGGRKPQLSARERERLTQMQHEISHIASGIGSPEGAVNPQPLVGSPTGGQEVHNIFNRGGQGGVVSGDVHSITIHDPNEPDDVLIDIPLENQPLLGQSEGLRYRGGRRPVLDPTAREIAQSNPFTDTLDRMPRPRRPTTSTIKKGVAGAIAGTVVGTGILGSQTSGSSTTTTPGSGGVTSPSDPSYNIGDRPGSSPDLGIRGELERMPGVIRRPRQKTNELQDQPILQTNQYIPPDSGVRGKFKIPRKGVYYPYKALPYMQVAVHNMFVPSKTLGAR